MRDLQRARFVEEPLTCRLIAVGHAAEDANRNRMTERAMDAAMDRAAKTARAERLTDLVGAEQAARRRQAAGPSSR